ncbi:MAG TPA: transcriptional regulator [Flavobacteriales bacterium]|jgi:DNA-binding HxlR family transcriptional regulator|nr:transcriptional regulator [Flavobacteriales bacterium]
MKQHPIHQLNKAFDNRARLGIVSALRARKDVTFNELKGLLELTDGNLATHLQALEKVDYIVVKKEFAGRKPKTSYTLTRKGKIAFDKHIEALASIINTSGL